MQHPHNCHKQLLVGLMGVQECLADWMGWQGWKQKAQEMLSIVSWALCKFYFIFYFIFLLLTKLFRYILLLTTTTTWGHHHQRQEQQQQEGRTPMTAPTPCLQAAALRVVRVRATPSNIPKWASCGLYKNSGSGEMRLMGWLWLDMIRNGKGQLVEIGMSHQIWWNILREHNWGVPSAHINFIYYVTCILECLIMLRGHARTGAYTIL